MALLNYCKTKCCCNARSNNRNVHKTYNSSVLVLKEIPCPRTKLHVLVLVLEPQVLVLVLGPQSP